MDGIAQSLLLPAAILVLLGALFIIVQMTAAVRVGEGEAIRRLKRWRTLPEAILRLATAPTPRVRDRRHDRVAGRGGEGGRGAGSVRGGRPGRRARQARSSPRAWERCRGTAIARRLKPFLPYRRSQGWATGDEEDGLVEIRARSVPSAARRIFPQLKSGRLVVLPIRLVDTGSASMPSALILLHIAGRRRLDQVDLEAIETAMRQLPRVVTGVTSRFAQAEVLEQLLEEARVKDGLLRMLLGSFQHDLGNTLASLQAGVARAWEAKEAQAGSDDTGDAEFAELYRTIQLAATVARSGEGMVDIAEGKSPIAVVEPYSPLEVFDQVVRPFVTLRARRRPELDVRIEIPDDLPAIYVDRVAFFRILSNVLHNAFKFTQKGAITVRAAEESGLVTFSIADTGPGIPPADVDAIGRYRFRGEAPSGTGGEGIGLWVTRRLLEAMGGAFRVESEAGRRQHILLGLCRLARAA